MESYANGIRRLVVSLLIFSGILNSAFAQNAINENAPFYGHFNIGLSANQSKLLSDSIPGLTYDFGLGASLEYEMFFNDKLSMFGSVGVSYIKSSTNSKDNTLSLLAVDIRVAPKYSLNGKFHIIAGPNVLYKIKSSVKTSYIDESWSSVEYVKDIQYGAFVGMEFYLNGWSALRTIALIRSESISYEISLIITPKLFDFP